MIRAVFDNGWAGWRDEARRLLAASVLPDRVVWAEAESAAQALPLFEDSPSAEAPPAPTGHRVPRRFVELGPEVACHRDPERWDLLYRVLWRLTHGEPKLLDVEVDADVRRLILMERAVGRAVHKMHAFVRFRATGGEHDPYVAWFEPEHSVLERATPFFARRFAAMRWSILTPDGCAHWDGDALQFTPGVPRSAAPAADALEALWRTYYAHIFNPARINPKAMRAEMPKHYWKNLPEAALIPELARTAPARAQRMVAQVSCAAEEPALRPIRSAPPLREGSGGAGPATTD